MMDLVSGVLLYTAIAIGAAVPQQSHWCGPVEEQERYVTTVPFTYVIGYGDWLADENLMRSLRESPPDLLHINQPVPINHMLGLTESFWDWYPAFISEDAYREKVLEVKAYVEELRKTGVGVIIPYINTSIMLGDHEKRTGFWETYDGWEKLSWLKLGPKPLRDPLLWCGVPRRSLDPYKPTPEYDLWRYEPSLGDPDWRNFQLRCVEEIAACGYDGLFVDDCIMASYAPVDQDRFSGFIASRPSGSVLPKLIPLGTNGQGLRYAETVRYFQHTVTEHVGAMLEAAKKFNPDFFVVPNWGSISRPDGLAPRERAGKSLDVWSRATRLMMLEESYGPGRIAADAIHDYALQYKQCLAYGVQPALLPYLNGRHTTALAYAEVAAGGGGAFVQWASEGQTRAAYTKFFHGNGELLGGLRPWSQVALLYDTDEAHYEYDMHIRDGMRMGRALLDAHIQFDVIAKKDLVRDKLKQYETVVVPNVSRISDQGCSALKAYVQDGGHLLVTGVCATHDEMDRARPRHGWGLAPWVLRGVSESHKQAGAGSVDYVRDIGRLLPASAVDVEGLSDIMPDGIEATLKEIEALRPVQSEPLHQAWADFVERYAIKHLSTTAGPEVRIHVYRRPDGLLTIHFVRYCVSPWEPDSNPPPPVMDKCRVELNLGNDFEVKDAYSIDAMNGRSPVTFKRRGPYCSFEINDLLYHRMVVVH